MGAISLKSQAPQTHFNRLETQSQKKTRKSQSKPKTIATEQLALFALPSSRVTVGVEPANYRVDRYCVTVRQNDLIWQLPPSLPKAQCFDLLDLLQEAGCCFEMDLNDGTPVEAGRLHALTECYINSLNLGLAEVRKYA